MTSASACRPSAARVHVFVVKCAAMFEIDGTLLDGALEGAGAGAAEDAAGLVTGGGEALWVGPVMLPAHAVSAVLNSNSARSARRRSALTSTTSNNANADPSVVDAPIASGCLTAL